MRKLVLFCFMLLMLPLTISQAQGRVRAVVTSEFANIRIIPAIGADVLGSVPAGYVVDPATARSADNVWLRFDFGGGEGWIHTSTLSIIEGDINSLPVADPRSIPYGGWDAPRAGLTNATGSIQARVTDWLRIRSGPSTGYVVLANAPINSTVFVMGRTANSNWLQVNYQGTLGWVFFQYIELPTGVILGNLPVDGIIADEVPPSTSGADDYFGTLQLMLDRINLAQPSLDQIRAMWTDASLTGRASCTPYPAQPSDFNIPQPLLAAYYTTLNPLITEFNDAMFNIRYAIDLFIEVCNQPGTGNPVGQATTQGALEVVSLADRQFIELRRRLDELIPDNLGSGADCLFAYNGMAQGLTFINIGQLVLETLEYRKMAVGFCFDAYEGQVLYFATQQREGGNAQPLVAVSPFSDPGNFLGVARGGEQSLSVGLGPIIIPATGRYLLVVGNIDYPEDAQLQAQIGILIYEANSHISGLSVDPVTGEIVVVITIPVIDPFATSPVPSTVCPNPSLTCAELFTCEQAYACLGLGNLSLDGDSDGVPCELVLCPVLPPTSSP